MSQHLSLLSFAILFFSTLTFILLKRKHVAKAKIFNHMHFPTIRAQQTLTYFNRCNGMQSAFHFHPHFSNQQTLKQCDQYNVWLVKSRNQ